MRTYVTLDVSELDSVNFDEVLQTNANTCIRSLDGTKTLVKYEGDMPASVEALNSKTVYTHEEILELLTTSEWQEEHNPPSE